MEISTEPAFLEVELPQTLLESPSVSTFLPDEEASIFPLLSSNGGLEPVLLSHPLSPTIVASDITSSNISNTDCKADTSSSGSSTGIAMDAMETASSSLFNKVNYHHLQNNNVTSQDSSSHCLKGTRRKSKETPSFVSWNWPLIRKCTFFVFLSGILAICSIVVAQIVSMPKFCNPKTAWYRGSVFYEIDPASFNDSNNDGIGDISGIIYGIDYLANLGVSGVRLNSIFPSGPHYDRDVNALTINTIRPELGNLTTLHKLANVLHAHNMSLLLDLPLQHVIAGRKDDEVLDVISKSLHHWIDLGVNGFYLKGLESLINNETLLMCLSSWKGVIGKDKVLIVGESFLKDKSKSELSVLLEHIDLVDFILSIENNSQKMKERIELILNDMPIADDRTWIHWSIGRNYMDTPDSSQSIISKIFAATIMQLILPGTPNIMHANAVAITKKKIKNNSVQPIELWAEKLYNITDQEINIKSLDKLILVQRMISLRDQSPSIYKNVVCKFTENKSNTQILAHSNVDVLIVVRYYPRKNSFVSITNFGSTKVVLDLTSMFYSGNEMLNMESNEKIYFKQFKVDAFNTIVVKLDK
ncbi:4F2 cell-surface antigen heavy chain-like isoform X1 [Drosophila novamexicana]|uniref:4F2 cell-surface antigen heavy chain-like isoform X1 n=2 Tax=Drosophila novamexicana TaxID=47314 RepID=UPI0011E5B92B|nr:4F2 cell-surface antigen heavy chain-like isoform X1 [Drosophila novamexicana]